MIASSHKTVELAEFAVVHYLAKRSGRVDEVHVPRSNREPFGKNICFIRAYPACNARFVEIGYPWNGFNTNLCFQKFIERTEVQQLRILEDLLIEASKHRFFHSGLGELLNRLACSGRINSAEMAQINARYCELARPRSKAGPNKAARDALILSILQILTGSEIGINAKRGETSQCVSNACTIIERVFASEFPALNLTYDAIRGIWDKRSRQ